MKNTETTELKKREVLRLSNEESHRITKECICTALVYLMTELPFEKITITAIINRSGVSRAAFYRNYRSKEDVLKELITELSQLAENSFRKALEYADPTIWMLESLQIIKNNKEMLTLVMKANIPYTEILDDAVLSAYNIKNGSPACYKAHAICSAIWCIIMEWVKNGMTETPETIVNIMLNTVKIPNIEAGISQP